MWRGNADSVGHLCVPDAQLPCQDTRLKPMTLDGLWSMTPSLTVSYAQYTIMFQSRTPTTIRFVYTRRHTRDPHNYICDVINDTPSMFQSDLFALPTTVTTTTTSPLLRVPKIRRRLSPQHLRHRPRCPRWSGSEMVGLQSLTRGPSVRSFACRARMS